MKAAFRYDVAGDSATLLIPGAPLCRRKSDERLVNNVKLERISLTSRQCLDRHFGAQAQRGNPGIHNRLRTLQGQRHLSAFSEAPMSSLSQEFLKGRPAEMQQASVVARLKVDIGLPRHAVIHNDFESVRTTKRRHRT